MATPKDESKAYLISIKIKEEFVKESNWQDFLVDHLDTARDRITKQKDRLNTLTETILEETLVEEINVNLQEMKSYLLTITSISELQKSNPDMWITMQHLLSLDRSHLTTRPDGRQVQDARKFLNRLVGFSPLAAKHLATALTQCQPPVGPGSHEPEKKKSGGLGGMLKKWGL